MKNIVMIIISVLMGALTLGIVLSISGRMNRIVELESSLPSLVETTVANMAEDKNYTIYNRREYIADFIEQLSFILDTESNVSVQVMKLDIPRGVLGIRVTAEYQYPNGKMGSVSCERVVVLNSVPKEQTEEYTVCFYLTKSGIGKENCYKSYIIFGGDNICAPAVPSADGKEFLGWKDVNDYLADFSQPVTQDLIYYAEWR